jgi:methylated-DNA-protein-cysteine methyltransferase related protein
MTIASTRAQDVAIILWELKRAEKLATLTSIARRAGFTPGPGSNTIRSCLKTVRRDWPHLEWWRAVADNGELPQEQASFLQRAGFATTANDGGNSTVDALDDQLIEWSETESSQPVGG